MTDLRPKHNGAGPDDYTWRNDLSPYATSALDRLLFSDTALCPINTLVLNTTIMSSDALRRAGLRSIDVMLDPLAGVHNHFPIVADFGVKK